jgi:hypothetical protein
LTWVSISTATSAVSAAVISSGSTSCSSKAALAAQGLGDVEVGREVAALADDHFALGCVLRRDVQRGAQHLVEVDGGAVGGHHFAGRCAYQLRDLVAQALRQFKPAGAVPRADQALAPFGRHGFGDAGGGRVGQRAQRIAVEVDHAFGQRELFAQFAQRVLRVEGAAVLQGCHGGFHIREFAQDGAHGGGVGLGQLERQGNQFVVAFGDVVEHQVFQHAQAVRQQLVVAGQVLAGGRVHAGGVYAYQGDVFAGQQFHGFRRDGGESVPGLAGLACGAQQHALRQVFQRMGDMLGQDQGAAIQAVDHAARPQVGCQAQLAGAGLAVGVVQRRIGMRAGVRRQRDAVDVDRAARRQRKMQLL